MTQIGAATVYPTHEEMIDQILKINRGHLDRELLRGYTVPHLEVVYRCRVLGKQIGMVNPKHQ